MMLVSIMLILILGTALMGLRNLNTLNHNVKELYERRVVAIQQLQAVSDAYAVNIVDAVNKANLGIITWERAIEELNLATKIVQENWGGYIEAANFNEEEQKMVAKADEMRNASSLPTFQRARELLGLKPSADNQQLLNIFIAKQLYSGIEPYTDVISELIDLQLKEAAVLDRQSDALFRASKITTLIVLLISVLFAVSISYLIISSITGGIKRGVAFAGKVASGDLTESVESEFTDRKDEIGQLSKALNAMVKRLQEIVGEILAGAEGIAKASQQMSATSQQLSQGANEQASSVEEVSSSMEQMVANIQQNTDNSQQTEKIALVAKEGIQSGSQATNTAVEAMKSIAERIRIINDIAFQTNILALNAAVEAARAGEHGRGFAVVAAEVRKLAERSKIAADEIDEMSRSGVSISEQAGKELEILVPEIEKTAQLVQEIAASSLEQNSGADQVNQALQQLNNVTQQNAAASEQLASSSQELASQAEQLKDIISYFTMNFKGESVSNTHQTKGKLQPVNYANKPKGTSNVLKKSFDEGFEKF